MKNYLFPLIFTCSSAFASDNAPSPGNAEAFINQFLVGDNGETIATAPILLNRTSGTFNTLPLEGIAAYFELWVYPAIGVDGGPVSVGDAQLKDTEVVGILPRISIDFDGVDPNESPRTRSDWEHKITVTIKDPVGRSNDGEIIVQDWARHFLVRKRFLAEEHIGSADADSQWQEVDSLPIYHTSDGQTESFTDNAYPSGVSNTNKWSGIIEYQVVLDNVADSPVPYLTLSTSQVRVWPVWDATFENFSADPVSQIPSNLEAHVNDIYPGTGTVVVEYQHRTDPNQSFDAIAANSLIEEPWTAIVSQDRLYTLTAIGNLNEPGDYRVRVATHYPWGLVEYNNEMFTALPSDDNGGNNGGVGNDDTGNGGNDDTANGGNDDTGNDDTGNDDTGNDDTGNDDTITVDDTEIIIRAGIHSLE